MQEWLEPQSDKEGPEVPQKKRDASDWFALIATFVVLYGLLGVAFVFITAVIVRLWEWAF